MSVTARQVKSGIKATYFLIRAEGLIWLSKQKFIFSGNRLLSRRAILGRAFSDNQLGLQDNLLTPARVIS
jgi:hypothetical protein